MSRRSSHATRGRSAPLPAWVWLSTGVLLGLLAAAVVLYGGFAPGLRSEGPQPTPGTGPAEPGAADEPAPANGRPRYDFYTVLPEMEVLMPDSELQARVRAETPTPGTGDDPTAPATANVPAGVRYRLQAGSFRDPRPAEEAKARLALLGVSASVQSVNINGTTWHRVYVGPYTSAAEVEQVKQQLASNGVQAIVMREAAP